MAHSIKKEEKVLCNSQLSTRKVPLVEQQTQLIDYMMMVLKKLTFICSSSSFSWKKRRERDAEIGMREGCVQNSTQYYACVSPPPPFALHTIRKV